MRSLAQRLDADAVEAAAGEGALQAECKLYLKGCLQRYAGGGGSGGIGNSGKSNGAGNSNSDSSRLAEVSVQIEEVKSTMANNIDQVMSNAESLRGVEDKSEAMLEDAATYRTRATAVKRTLFLRMWKLRIIGACMRACARVRVCACLSSCVCAREHACVSDRACACTRAGTPCERPDRRAANRGIALRGRERVARALRAPLTRATRAHACALAFTRMHARTHAPMYAHSGAGRSLHRWLHRHTPGDMRARRWPVRRAGGLARL